MNDRLRILVFPDAVGISEGYRGIWLRLLSNHGVNEKTATIRIRSSYSFIGNKSHLEWHKKRKQPGFSTDFRIQQKLRAWVASCIEQERPNLVVIFDPALLFLVNDNWDQATLDKLRGSVYIVHNIPWIVTLPMTAFHTRAKPKDIAALNQGFTEKGEFNDYMNEEDDDDIDSADTDDEKAKLEWHEPVVIPYGKIMLHFDWAKISRIMEKLRNVKIQANLLDGTQSG